MNNKYYIPVDGNFTGVIQVRFAKLVNAEDFAKSFKIKLVGKNKFTPFQFSFTTDADTIVDKIIEIAENDSRVQKVWPETMMNFKRGEKP